jgi:hypothetical protein
VRAVFYLADFPRQTDRAISRGSCTSTDGQLAHQRVSRTSWEGPPGARTYTKVLGRTGWEARWCTCLNARWEARSAPYCWEAAEVAPGKEPAFLVRSMRRRPSCWEAAAASGPVAAGRGWEARPDARWEARGAPSCWEAAEAAPGEENIRADVFPRQFDRFFRGICSLVGRMSFRGSLIGLHRGICRGADVFPRQFDRSAPRHLQRGGCLSAAV